VAIYHCSVKPVSRSAGRSATAAAAYRAGDAIADERTGQVHDYRRRSGVASVDIVLPAGAAASLAERSALWNAAELAEKRRDGCTAREYVVALPEELDAGQRRQLALDFAQALAARHGVAADVAIHAPGREGDQRNHHAHLLTTTRVAGPGGLGAKADIEKSGRNRKADLGATRLLWARLANDALERAGRPERIDHRSLADQGGNDREPTPHLGPSATMDMRRAQRTGEPAKTERAAQWVAVRDNNAARRRRKISFDLADDRRPRGVFAALLAASAGSAPHDDDGCPKPPAARPRGPGMG